MLLSLTLTLSLTHTLIHSHTHIHTHTHTHIHAHTLCIGYCGFRRSSWTQSKSTRTYHSTRNLGWGQTQTCPSAGRGGRRSWGTTAAICNWNLLVTATIFEWNQMKFHFYLSVYWSIYLSIYLSIHLFLCLSLFLSLSLSNTLSLSLSLHLSFSFYLYISLPLLILSDVSRSSQLSNLLLMTYLLFTFFIFALSFKCFSFNFSFLFKWLLSSFSPFHFPSFLFPTIFFLSYTSFLLF